ncbi:unnamed protein product, partial [Rotaria sordida]
MIQYVKSFHRDNTNNNNNKNPIDAWLETTMNANNKF